jgi:hypothetical protein
LKVMFMLELFQIVISFGKIYPRAFGH